MKLLEKLLRERKAFEASAEGTAFDLRLDLADLIIAGLREKGWTQKKLADRAGMKESFISRVINAESNCTFDVAGRILHALGMKASLVKAQPQRCVSAPRASDRTKKPKRKAAA